MEQHGQDKDRAVREEVCSSVLKTMLVWLRMKPLSVSEDPAHADYVIVLADELSSIDHVPGRPPKVIALLPHESKRAQTEGLLSQRFEIYETISAPFGPRKLARVVAGCEIASTRRQRSSESIIKSADTNNSKFTGVPVSTDNVPTQQHSQHNSTHPDDQSGLSEMSRQAHTVRNCLQKGALKDPINSSETTLARKNPPLQKRSGNVSEPDPPAGARAPRVLLVDDNKINLSLLETFIKRQKRKLDYDCAENGLLAVEAARQNPSGYAIIFMDVSMPGMDGLEATREIRKLEKKRVAELGEETAPAPALIVALTGLANGRDQSDAFASGVDLFMTKPTKFMEIGNLINEWYDNKLHHDGAGENASPGGQG
jgi:CheY-like chemotaxis protein